MTPAAGARVIVHADDFGLHPALNAGIERAHREGLVSSASLMPLGPAFDDALLRCRALPDLDLGLHFTLVGVPGCPTTLSAFLSRYGRGLIPAREIAPSQRRQLETFRDQNITPSHLDSHQHLHALPGIMRVVCPIAAEYGVAAIRLPVDGRPHALVPPPRKAQAAALRAIAGLSRRYLAVSGLRTSDHFAGMAVSGHLTAQTLVAYLADARTGLTEIVCHPGADNAALRASFDWGYDWEEEMAALCSSVARREAARSSLALTDWRREA